ncbi:MAG: hypothetical protein M5U08_04585 [Burkholderiales bacterium]|nr:hypothetical protein [Burkholderiales bacterium]
MTALLPRATIARDRPHRYPRLAKPPVVTLIVFCALVGTFLATPATAPPSTLVAGALGESATPRQGLGPVSVPAGTGATAAL